MSASAFRAAWTGVGRDPGATRTTRYAYLAAWDAGTVFTGDPASPAAAAWGETLKQQYRLYRQTRLVYNPVPDLTEFWGSVIYPGTLPRSGVGTAEHPSAIPFPDATDPALVAAAAQIWWWSGMQHLKYVIPHWAAQKGNLLLKVVDDVRSAKVYLRPVPPDLVADLVLSPSGDLLFLATEEQITPDIGPPYVYREEISKTTFRTFRDGQPADFSGDLHLGAVWPNPWGFVPACWVPFQPTGTPYAAPAIGSALPELLEINSLQSMLDDGVARGMKPIPWFATSGDVTQLGTTGKAGATSGLDPEDAGRESFVAFKLPADAAVGKLDPSGNVADIAAYLATRKQEFQAHFSELSMWESLRARDVSGIAAEILHGDTRNKVLNIRPGIDRQVEKATQMAITIAAIRYHTTWQRADPSRAVFAPFTAKSWDAGDLDFAIAERPLVPTAPLSALEKATLADILLNKLHLPPAYVYEQLGVPAPVVTQAATLAANAQVQAAARLAQLPQAGPPTPGDTGIGGTQ